MATQMGILSCGVILTFTAVLTGFLSIPVKGNAIDQRVLQRDLGDSSSEIMSLTDKDDFREIDEPAVNSYAIKTKVCSLKNNFSTLKFFTNNNINKNRRRIL